ncbi:LacI family DNA-binding transcriptional regulator [Streptomyces ipomoeae]|nr:LacI family DNA-binding transcriptional regulator [Streptomyces ipomoeae]MDX2693315.1 LacI family DNA-binding transcriptional regulator [Streptomyces ipomoeae]MDX2838906.1 LacI family DNA-binding transcriptional regulator [Streptomyces ipomoeae]MDX2874530.1 LacI family DNA-binding transcriptional regulator [Streptomyces ipomoeae]
MAGQRETENQRARGVRTAKRVTLRDVAQAAGVSHQTVSRAINGKGEIDPATQQRVLDVAKRLRYRPSRFGRGLARPDVVSVGLIVPDVVNPFFPEFVAGVIAAADERDWQVLVASTENDRSRELALVRSLGQQVDALVGYISHPDAQLEPYVGTVPLVIVDRGLDSSNHALVHIDTAAGIRAGMQHLIDRGHRRIGMIDCECVSAPLVRRRTFLEVAGEHALPVDEGWIVMGEQSPAGGAAAFEALYAARPDLTAVVAFNDLVAIGALRAARRLGVQVPDDCALVGYDGLSVVDLVDPPLTTLHLDKRRLGELAIHQVDQLLAGELPPPIVLTPSLHVRGTT